MVQAIPPRPTVADGVTAVVATVDEQARRQHYGQFYELEERPDGAGFLLGNCQAESLRIVMHHNRAPLVRIPPVHELTAEDMPFLERLIATASSIIAQPISDDYHSLPLGTRQVFARASASTRTVTVPIVRFTGLHPFQAVVRVPGVSEAPPIVDYHDVREVALAAGLPLPETLGREAVRAIAGDSIAELRRRESELDVSASDLFASPSFDQMRTVNHPGNAIWLALGERILETLQSPVTVTDPGRPMLNSVIAPREPWVAEAWGLDEDTREDWMVGGVTVPAAEVRAAQAAWYRDHPEVVAHAARRLAPTFERWRAA